MIDRLPWAIVLTVAPALSMSQSNLLSLGQSINPDNALYIGNYYIISGISQQIFPKTVIALNPC